MKRRGLGLCSLIVPPVVLPVPGEEFVEPALRRLRDPAEDIGEPGLRIDVVELGGADDLRQLVRAADSDALDRD